MITDQIHHLLGVVEYVDVFQVLEKFIYNYKLNDVNSIKGSKV